jgi:uncharacterized membrane protein (UPF0127 family)
MIWHPQPPGLAPLLLSALLLSAAPALAQAPGQAMGQAPAGKSALPDFSTFSVGAPNAGLRVITLPIETASGLHRYRVEVAETPEQQARGMMFRKSMARDSGMLFPMVPPRPAAFWMRNTYVSLDIIFLSPDERVLNIAAQVPPLTDTTRPSAGVTGAVLELKGGEAARIGLKPGDRVRWKAALGAPAGTG